MHPQPSPSASEVGQIWTGLGGGCIANSSTHQQTRRKQQPPYLPIPISADEKSLKSVALESAFW